MRKVTSATRHSWAFELALDCGDARFVLFGLLVAFGCSPSPPPKAASPADPGAQTRRIIHLPPVLSFAPTTMTQVHVDDAILRACGIRTDKAYFAFDSAKLEPDDNGTLGEVANCFTTGPLKRNSLKLIGRADPRGEHEYNMVLGQSRADTVGSFLKGKGLDEGRMNTSSRGAMDATGTDEPSWARDRRVDILLGS
jgi:peptidoglycan-associated lipoprotein